MKKLNGLTIERDGRYEEYIACTACAVTAGYKNSSQHRQDAIYMRAFSAYIGQNEFDEAVIYGYTLDSFDCVEELVACVDSDPSAISTYDDDLETVRINNHTLEYISKNHGRSLLGNQLIDDSYYEN